MIRFSLVLAIALAALWITLSGYFKPMLLILGVISILFVVAMSARMKITDDETAPYIFIPQTLAYFVWLFSEIVKANVQVIQTVLKPELEVTPTLTKIPLTQTADISKVMFANSITLTPGTVSVSIEQDHILVHALLDDMSDAADFTEMGEKAAWAVGEKTWLRQTEGET